VKEKFRIDDTLDVFAVHGVGGIFGAIMAPILASEALGGGGLSEGQGLMTQLTALAAVGVFTLVVTFVLAKVAALVFPIRVSEEEEVEGLDYSNHGEQAYDWVS
jgi:Amt family ammonium transporter